MAVLSITIQDLQTAALPHMFGLFKMCLLADTFSVKQSDIQKQEQEEQAKLEQEINRQFYESYHDAFIIM